MKKLLLSLVLLSFCTLLFGQTTVNFYGYSMIKYQGPVKSGNEYEAYYERVGDLRDAGRVILYDSLPQFRFTIYGTGDFTAIVDQFEYVNESTFYGKARTVSLIGHQLYSDNIGLKLKVYVIDEGNCITEFHYDKINDERFDFESYNQILTLATQGACFDNLSQFIQKFDPE
ncbi:MAG: hypothetical protein ABJH72_04345 [Reichenbachiella sp.]|uniref:hypothetical protein n=1 Tax=Reichenbachiella sp. TaxID=2184521 RepID=UPI003298FFB0